MEQNDQMPPGFWEQVSDTIDICNAFWDADRLSDDWTVRLTRDEARRGAIGLLESEL